MRNSRTPAHFCSCEQLDDECSNVLTHRAPYWLGSAQQRLGPYAYWCDHHAHEAWHLCGFEQLKTPVARHAREEILARTRSLISE